MASIARAWLVVGAQQRLQHYQRPEDRVHGGDECMHGSREVTAGLLSARHAGGRGGEPHMASYLK